MELDDLKSAWKSLDSRLAAQNAMAFMALKDARTARAKSALRPLLVGQCIQLTAGALLCIPFASFWIEHRATPHLLVFGLMLHGYAVLLILFAARELYQISSIDYAASVVDIQRRLATLRNWRVRAAPVFGFTGCFVWIPFMLVIFRSLGVDVWVNTPSVVLWFVASGAVAAIVLGVFMWVMRRPGSARFARSLQDDAAGKSVIRAQKALADIAAFEREDGVS